ncbi:hypothetical protein ACEPAI_7765 [Sanghuangporus weigelae]
MSWNGTGKKALGVCRECNASIKDPELLTSWHFYTGGSRAGWDRGRSHMHPAREFCTVCLYAQRMKGEAKRKRETEEDGMVEIGDGLLAAESRVRWKGTPIGEIEKYVWLNIQPDGRVDVRVEYRRRKLTLLAGRTSAGKVAENRVATEFAVSRDGSDGHERERSASDRKGRRDPAGVMAVKSNNGSAHMAGPKMMVREDALLTTNLS